MIRAKAFHLNGQLHCFARSWEEIARVLRPLGVTKSVNELSQIGSEGPDSFDLNIPVRKP